MLWAVTVVLATALFWALAIAILANTGDGNAVAFLHPSCAGGGGGERVLWCAVHALLQSRGVGASNEALEGARSAASDASSDLPPPRRIVVYTQRYRPHGKSVSASDLSSYIRECVVQQFGEETFAAAVSAVELIPLWTTPLLEPRRYPVLTLLLQTLAGGVVALEIALRHLRNLAWYAIGNRLSANLSRRWHLSGGGMPAVLIDSVGVPFALPCLKAFTAGRLYTAAYVHYPLVSGEMEVAAAASRQRFGKRWRLLYYRWLLLPLYERCGQFTDVVMVNSSWTQAHMRHRWRRWSSRLRNAWLASADPKAGADAGERPMSVVYPPCGPFEEAAAPAPLPDLSCDTVRQRWMSIGQFRPEKRHALQADAFATALERYRQQVPHLQLTMFGGVRNGVDRARVTQLQHRVASCSRAECPTAERVHFVVNAPRATIERALRSGEYGVYVHTMRDEHFGISIVEAAAAGLLVVAHASGGARADILNAHDGGDSPEPLGLLFHTDAELVERIADAAFRLPPSVLQAMQQRAQRRCRARFSDAAFCRAFWHGIAPLLLAAAAT
eukprot:ctg_3219.g613